jgi:hypothetical protein
MSEKSGTVVPSRTRTCVPTAYWAGARVLFGRRGRLFLFRDTIGSPDKVSAASVHLLLCRRRWQGCPPHRGRKNRGLASKVRRSSHTVSSIPSGHFSASPGFCKIRFWPSPKSATFIAVTHAALACSDLYLPRVQIAVRSAFCAGRTIVRRRPAGVIPYLYSRQSRRLSRGGSSSRNAPGGWAAERACQETGRLGQTRRNPLKSLLFHGVRHFTQDGA